MRHGYFREYEKRAITGTFFEANMLLGIACLDLANALCQPVWPAVADSARLRRNRRVRQLADYRRPFRGGGSMTTEELEDMTAEELESLADLQASVDEDRGQQDG